MKSRDNYTIRTAYPEWAELKLYAMHVADERAFRQHFAQYCRREVDVRDLVMELAEFLGPNANPRILRECVYAFVPVRRHYRLDQILAAIQRSAEHQPIAQVLIR